MKTSLRIVQFADETYAVQHRDFLLWSYCDRIDQCLHEYPRPIIAFCIVKTLEEAENILARVTGDILYRREQDKQRKQKLPKITRIIKTVKV